MENNNANYWANTPDDTDRKRRREAEFLIHSFFSWDLIETIGVIEMDMKDRVDTIIHRLDPDHKPRVEIKREFINYCIFFRNPERKISN
ncbi:MAG: DUF4433 domain-containing protein [Methanospirillaceae archaeon]|nr:DUF4433 domain-containing protein [Methanospirillaceae archaeon]